MCKLKASVAFEHVKALWPVVVGIEKDEYGGWRAVDDIGSLVTRGSGVIIDWEGEKCFPVPVKVIYRESTLADIGGETEVEFSGSPDFGVNSVVKGKLTGRVYRHGKLVWQQYEGTYWSYCRIPVTVPAGWREITKADKNTFGPNGNDPNCDLRSDTGEIAHSCYWNHDEQWKVYGGPSVTFTPAFIRKAQ